MGAFEWYLLAINVIGFVLFAVNTWLYSNTEDSQIDSIITVVSIVGGSLGIFLSILAFDRKAQKGTMMSRVFVVCVLVIQVAILVFLNTDHSDGITLAFWSILAEHKAIVAYLAVINIVTFAAFAIDKFNAVHKRGRIRIVTLLGLAFIGGSFGAILAMYLFRHKTKKDYFTVGIPLIIIMQVIVIFCIINM